MSAWYLIYTIGFVSTHAPVSDAVITFQSTHPPLVGVTIINDNQITDVLFQSTHPCRVRYLALPQSSYPKNFNPRTLVGTTCNPSELCKCFLISIHAPVSGATIRAPRFRNARAHFNPRTRVGCDLPSNAIWDSNEKFQSTYLYGCGNS